MSSQDPQQPHTIQTSAPVRWNRSLAPSEEAAVNESFALEESTLATLQTNLELAIRRQEATREALDAQQQELDIAECRVRSLKTSRKKISPHDANAPGISNLLGMVEQLGSMVDSILNAASETTDHCLTLYNQVNHKFGVARASLSIWDETIARFQSQIQSSKSCLEDLKRHNAPSTRIPDDILRLIFRNAVAFDRTHQRSPSVFLEEWNFRVQYPEIPLSSVCHRWRTIVLDDPTLWSQICVPHYFTPGLRRLFEHYLTLASRVPIHLYILILREPRTLPDDLQLGRSDRIYGSISILNENPYTDISALLQTLPSPRILRLLYGHPDTNPSPSIIHIPMNMMGSLEEIHLQHYWATWTDPAPSLLGYWFTASKSSLATHEMVHPTLVPMIKTLNIIDSNPGPITPSTPLIYTTVEQLGCSLPYFMSSYCHQFRFPSLKLLAIICRGKGTIEEWKHALHNMETFPTTLACFSTQQHPLLLIQCVSLIKGLETLRLLSDTVDHGLDLIVDGTYKTDAETTASTVFKELKMLIVSEYRGDGQSIARFVSTFSPPKVALCGCTRLSAEVRASIARYTSLVP
ncbi:hypothetical protein PIIN_08118 [Serendipita indica DSM 11827]|uniref:Uncharacterized protein n=1 Tax=Serendipita indica (strain DSM 11827) TaxID=1109443 RepID=G4TS72_SERID|nr:hypothetical protein PIIN_08118 [Serendipita indica DSM 11827]